jgi:aspartate racemase
LLLFFCYSFIIIWKYLGNFKLILRKNTVLILNFHFPFFKAGSNPPTEYPPSPGDKIQKTESHGQVDMKAIGLIGGMSWESTADYYRLINEGIKERLGGFHSAKILLSSVDFAEYEAMQREDRWKEAGFRLANEARALEQAGAASVLLCTNTMHKVASAIQMAINIPFLHIADPTGRAIQAAGFKKIGLLGTRFTMEQDFFRNRLEKGFDLEVAIPQPEDRLVVHHVIYEELCLGIIRQESIGAFQGIIERLAQNGCQGIILGCTEIGMLIHPENSSLSVFDTTRLHAAAAVEFSLS